VKSSARNVKTDTYSLVLMIYFILKMNNPHDSATSHRTEHNKKIFRRVFCCAIVVCLHRFCSASTAHLLPKTSRFDHLLTPRYVQNTPCIILVDFEKFIMTFSCLYYCYSNQRCYSIICHSTGGH
jgi:hypothetical protein